MKRYLPLFIILLSTACTEQGVKMNLREQMSTVDITIDNEGRQPELLYTANISSKNTYCGSDINYMKQLNNLGTSSGSFMSGFNASAFLKQGHNKLELWVASLDAYEGESLHREGAWCEVKLFASFSNGEQQEMSSVTITEEKGIPTAKTSKIYPSIHQTPLETLEEETNGKVAMFRRSIYIKTIPRWRWVDATPFDETNREHMKKLYRAYDNLLEMMRQRDFEGLAMAWSLSNREKAKAEAYYTSPEAFFNAVGFESTFERYGDDGKVKPRQEWYDYQLKSFMGGRLFRLEDKRSQSPLRIGSVKKDWFFTVTPYFSLIDGRVVVSR